MLLTNNERDHAGTVASSGFKPLDQLLHLPYLDLEAAVSERQVDARHEGQYAPPLTAPELQANQHGDSELLNVRFSLPH